MSFTPRLDVDIEPWNSELDPLNIYCLDNLGIGIGNRPQYQVVFPLLPQPLPQYRAPPLRIAKNQCFSPFLLHRSPLPCAAFSAGEVQPGLLVSAAEVQRRSSSSPSLARPRATPLPSVATEVLRLPPPVRLRATLLPCAPLSRQGPGSGPTAPLRLPLPARPQGAHAPLHLPPPTTRPEPLPYTGEAPGRAAPLKSLRGTWTPAGVRRGGGQRSAAAAQVQHGGRSSSAMDADHRAPP